ncbi:MAG: lipid A export permease/ATP-binding protein MsbA [Deltaproteobacteria bacterium RBG_16_54_18]|nr:MAG: lipid A export permease/ATP-binding protein MsbA [Deltaproteobacteria bacterium RBG_16_54_18]
MYFRILKFVRPYWPRLLIAMVCMGGVSAITAAFALLTKNVLDDIFINKDQFMLLVIPLAVMGLGIIKGFFSFGEGYLMNYVGQRVVADIRERLYSHLQTLSLSFFDRTPTGVLMARITNDVNAVQGAVSDAVTGMIKDAFTAIGLVAVVFYRDWLLALVAIFVFPLAAYPLVAFSRKLRKISKRTLETMAYISTFLQETIFGHRIVKAFNMEAYENGRFHNANEQYFKYLMKRVKIRALSNPVMEWLAYIGIGAFVWVGGYRVINGSMTVGEFFSFMTAMALLYDPMRGISKVNLVIQEGIVAARRVFDILDLKPEVTDQPHAKPLPGFSHVIEYHNIIFRYDKEVVLDRVSFSVKAGEKVALVGSSGAGKTTAVNLLPRFYDVTKGKITIDGIDIRQVTLQSLRRQIGVVSQQTLLFNDTVRSNIAYGRPDIPEREVIKAAQMADAHDFISKLPQRYDTVIGEQGVMLSGGQRQRISIARALLKNAPILILDEATSSLDTESEREVQEALDRLMEKRTVLVIAHRLSTVRNVDRILVLSEGRIVEEGNHKALMAKGGEYKKLYELQFQDADRPLQEVA